MLFVQVSVGVAEEDQFCLGGVKMEVEIVKELLHPHETQGE